LPNFTVTRAESTEHDYHLEATYELDPSHCPHCQDGTAFQAFGTKAQLFMDLPAHGKRVGVIVKRQRYRCKRCERTFLQRLPDMDEHHAMTKRLLAYIQQESLKDTFVRVAENVGVSEGTIRNIFKDYVAHLQATTHIATPTQLGIDEIYISSKPRCILSNIEERTIVDLLPTRTKSAVQNRLLRFPERKQIAFVCSDMWVPYKEAAKAALPQAQLVVDKYHVVRMANQALEKVRKELQSDMDPKLRRTLKMYDRYTLLKRRHDLSESQQLRLEVWTKNVPLLGQAYELKEAFYGLWEIPDRRLAIAQYQTWRQQIPTILVPAFSDLTTAIENWQTEIFAYFDYKLTNAYTESLNALVRSVDRAGKGLTFKTLWAKMLFCAGLHRQYRPKYRHPGKQRIQAAASDGEIPLQHETADTLFSPGAQISTFAHQLELEFPDTIST
ncbi:MAG: ISL3 family transposase, partial [Chloroflexi bacterium]